MQSRPAYVPTPPRGRGQKEHEVFHAGRRSVSLIDGKSDCTLEVPPGDALRKLRILLEQANANTHTWNRIAEAPPVRDARDTSSLKALAELVEEKALAVRKERENSIVPLCGHVDRRRKQIVQALEDRKGIKSENRQLRGQLEGLQLHAHALEAERDALCAANTANQTRAENLAEDRGSLKQQVATLEEKCLVEKMVTHKLRHVLVEISTSAEIVAKQLSIAVPESECALRNAHQLAEHTDKLSEELKTCNSQIKHAQEKAAVAHQQLADAQAAIAAHSINVMDLKTELSAATVVSDDLQAQLFKALAAKCALSDRVDTVLSEMDEHNRALGVAVSAAEAAKKPLSREHTLFGKMPLIHMPVLEEHGHTNQRLLDHAAPFYKHDKQSTPVLSVSVHLESGVLEESGKAREGENKENGSQVCTSNKSTPTTPKAALRKRLLEARNALGGVKLGDAPKRSVSFHPSFRGGVCDDDLV